MSLKKLFFFLKQRFKRKKKLSLNYDFLRRVEPAIGEIMHSIEDLSYKQRTFDLIGSNTCLVQINTLTLELKNLVEDLISLEKRFKYSSNYAVLSEIEDAKKFCHESFIHLYDIFNLIQNNTLESLSNETLLSIISRLETDVRQVDYALKKIGHMLLETRTTHIGTDFLKEPIDINAVHSESRLHLIRICMMAYEGLISMPFLSHQETAYCYLEKYKMAMENMTRCLMLDQPSIKEFESARYELISTLESIRFCVDRDTKIGRTLEIKIKVMTQNLRKAASQIDIGTKTHTLEK